MPNMATAFPTHWTNRLSNPRCWIGTLRDRPPGQQRLALVQELLAIRRREIIPRLAGTAFGEAGTADSGLLTANWRMGDGATLSLLANLSDRIAQTAAASEGTLIWGQELNGGILPWSVFWRIG